MVISSRDGLNTEHTGQVVNICLSLTSPKYNLKAKFRCGRAIIHILYLLNNVTADQTSQRFFKWSGFMRYFSEVMGFFKLKIGLACFMELSETSL